MSTANNFSVPLLNKLIQLASIDLKCFNFLVELAREPASFDKTLLQLEQHLSNVNQANHSVKSTAQSPENPTDELANLVADSTTLHRLFLNAPRFSQVSPQVLVALAQFADVKPDTQTILHSKDCAFLRILRSDVRLAETTVQQLMREDLTFLIELYVGYPSVFGAIYELASSECWSTQMLTVESALAHIYPKLTDENLVLNNSWKEQLSVNIENAELDNETTQQLLGILSSIILNELNRAFFVEIIENRNLDLVGIKLLISILELPKEKQPDLLQHLLQKKLRLSELLPIEITSLWNIRFLIPENQQAMLRAQMPNRTTVGESTRLADKILAERLLKEEDEYYIRMELDLRLKAIRHFLRLRKIAKVDAFRYRWPMVAQLLQTDRTALSILESKAIERSTEIELLPKRWKNYLYDEELMHFLRLRPLFSDIYPNELGQLLKSAQSFTLTSTFDKPIQSLSKLELASLTSLELDKASAYVDSKLTKDESSFAVQISTRYESIFVRIYQDSNDSNTYQVTLEYGNVSRKSSVHVDWSKFNLILKQYKDFIYRIGLTIRESTLDQVDLTRDIGITIAETFLGLDIKTELFIRLQDEQMRFRIFLDFEDPRLTEVPWETLYIPVSHTHLGLTHKYSIVRFVSRERPIPPRQIEPPLRILAVLASPNDFPQLNIDMEASILNRTLAAAIQSRQVNLQILQGIDATWENLQQAMRTVQPHFLHFVGHSAENTFLLQSTDGRGYALKTYDLVNLLADWGVSVVILNGCDTGSSSSSEVITGIANGLTRAGVSSVIATVGIIDDNAALMFSREFYRSFADGYNLETSLTEARKSLSIERSNWMTYALFANSDELDKVRLTVRK